MTKHRKTERALTMIEQAIRSRSVTDIALSDDPERREDEIDRLARQSVPIRRAA